MNLNFTSFPLIEKILVYGGVFISSVFIIILSSFLYLEKTDKKITSLFYYVSLALMFFLDILLFFYIKAPVETVAGIEINKIYLFILIFVICNYLLTIDEFDNTEDYIMGLISIIVLHSIFLNSSLIVVFIAFIVFEITNSYLNKHIKPQKYFYIIISLIFTGFFLLSDKTRIQTISINGGLVFLLLSTFSFINTIDSISIKEKGKNKISNYVFLEIVVSIAVFFKFIEFFNRWSPSIYPLFMVSFIFLLFSVFNLLTEEDTKSFFVFDFINVFMISVLSFSVVNINNMDILIIIIAMLFAAVFLSSFFSNLTRKYSVSFVRYNFNKIKSAGNIFLTLVITLFVEIYIIYRIMNNFLSFNSYVQMIILFSGFVYIINLLNKIFIIFSIGSRIKIDNLKYILFNKIIIRSVLFVLLNISLVIWWIKNG